MRPKDPNVKGIDLSLAQLRDAEAYKRSSDHEGKALKGAVGRWSLPLTCFFHIVLLR
jgi:hypothetical protein